MEVPVKAINTVLGLFYLTLGLIIFVNVVQRDALTAFAAPFAVWLAVNGLMGLYDSQIRR